MREARRTTLCLSYPSRKTVYSLIGNAIKFARPDVPLSIQIKSSFEAGKASHMDSYRIDISDNGIGFDPAYNERVFEMFRTLHAADKFEGRGIGLAITRKIIEKLGGTIVASSTQDRGTMFSIRLPVSRTT